jgi:two-component system response regulator RegA
VKPRFLILDDNEVFAATLARSLTRRGFDATVAQNGRDALDLARMTPFRFITVDLHLAQDSGLQWIAPLRHALPLARILVLTGYASITTTVQAVKSGADDYLAKPTNVDSILAALGCEQSATAATVESSVEPTPLSVDRLEWEHIQRVLSDHEGNISSTARALSMHRRTLQRKLRKKPSAIG